MHYSVFNIISQAFKGQKDWKPVWRYPDPKAEYDMLIIGGGGHGLATAYYLAKNHGYTNIAVIEKNYLGSGSVGRNTTIVRSNYQEPGNIPFYEHSLKLWEGLEQDLNYNAMMSQRGVLNLYHSDSQRDDYARRGNAMMMHGVRADLLNREQVREVVPFLDFDNARFPIHGGLMQWRGGTARHDAVAWGFARGADSRGVDILQNTEAKQIRVENGKVVGVETSRGFIKAKKVGIVAAGNTTRIAETAGLRLPIESYVLQAFVSEAIKPLIPCVVTFGAGHFYISQSDKGGLVFGASLDYYTSYAARGNLPGVEDTIEEAMAIMPSISRVKLLRHWGGIMDMSMDGSPIIDKTGIDGLYINCGWCYGGFKATPASGYCMAHLMATDESHSVATALKLNRFETGYVIDEAGTGAQPNLH